MSTTNVLAMIHGMTPDPEPPSPVKQFDDFWKRLIAWRPELSQKIQHRVSVVWGHKWPDAPRPPGEDEVLSRVQKIVSERVRYENVKGDPHPNNVVMKGLFGRDYGIPIFRGVMQALREQLVQFGLGDVVYYTASDGEAHVRKTVYEQVLQALEPHRDATDVRLHLIGQSLGVTICHDFLYGLFNTSGDEPHFVTHAQGSEQAREMYEFWRERARPDGGLKLGTFIGTASQLPLFVLRKQHLIERLDQGELLDVSQIGVRPADPVQWLLFYDIDDVLGFATRRLYQDCPGVKEIQVDSGDEPLSAHTKYWTNETVVRESAELLVTNSSN